MQFIPDNSDLHSDMRQWRRDIHAHPETAYDEHRTSAIVAEKLTEFGIEVHRGLAKTGVVGVLRGQQDGPMIGLRADMDALHLQELNTFEHASKHAGKMHACGHDGHTTMLLGAAKHLANHPDFAGTVVFIFQPAEEGEAGGRVMCEDGLFEQFPVQAVYGMHNWPALEPGEFAVHSGPVMAAMDFFDIQITGHGAHAGMPHLGVDPVVVAGQLIGALQSIVSRSVNPAESGVISVTKMIGGDAYNVIPASVTLSGTVRSFDPQVQSLIESRMREMVEHTCAAHGAHGELNYRKLAPATINDPEHADRCAQAAACLGTVKRSEHPSMGAEDFAFMLQEKPGAYIWIGNGSGQGGKGLHNPRYDFNDDVLALGASFWVGLVYQELTSSNRR